MELKELPETIFKPTDMHLDNHPNDNSLSILCFDTWGKGGTHKYGIEISRQDLLCFAHGILERLDQSPPYAQLRRLKTIEDLLTTSSIESC